MSSSNVVPFRRLVRSKTAGQLLAMHLTFDQTAAQPVPVGTAAAVVPLSARRDG